MADSYTSFYASALISFTVSCHILLLRISPTVLLRNKQVSRTGNNGRDPLSCCRLFFRNCSDPSSASSLPLPDNAIILEDTLHLAHGRLVHSSG